MKLKFLVHVYGVHKLSGKVKIKNIHLFFLLFRSILNFQIGDDAELMPKEIITAMVTIKKAAARVNAEMNGLPKEISEAIQQAADEVKINDLRHLYYITFLGSQW